MFKNILILTLSTLLIFSCGKKNKDEISQVDTEEIGKNLYAEGVEALKDGDAFLLIRNLEKLKLY